MGTLNKNWMFCATKVLWELRWTECRNTCVRKTVASFFLTELIYTRLLEKYSKHKKGRSWYWLRNNNTSYWISNTLSCRNENNYVYTHMQPHTTFSMTEKDNRLTGYLLRLYTHSQMSILEPSFYSLLSLLLPNYKLLSELLCSKELHLAAQSQFLCKNLSLNKEMCISNKPKGR